MDCEAIQELLEDYVFGSLADQDRRRVDVHLERCERCRARVAEYEELLARLPEALAVVSDARPEPEVKQRLLHVFAARTPGDARPGPKGLVSRRIALAVAAVLLALVVAATTAFTVTLDRQRALRAKLDGLVEDQPVVFELADSSRSEKSPLMATEPYVRRRRAYGKLLTNPEFRSVVVMANRLPKPPEGLAYHVWLAHRDRPKMVGVLKLDDSGFGVLVFEAQRKGPRYESAQVVLQPGGSNTPTGRRVLTWRRGPTSR
jgi:hypothetical protein